MSLVLDGTLGVDLIQDGSVTSAKIVDGTIAQGDMSLAASGIGVGQTWQNVSGSRVSGTTYTNSTGKPISVLCGHYSSGGGTPTWTVAGISWTANTNANSIGVTSIMSIIVPNGTTYSYTGVISVWLELR